MYKHHARAAARTTIAYMGEKVVNVARRAGSEIESVKKSNAEVFGFTIPTKEIKKVYIGGSRDAAAPANHSHDDSKSSLAPQKLLYLLEYAGKDLKLVRMAVPIRDMESENLLDYLDPSLGFIGQSRKEGSILVQCFAGVSRSVAIIMAYLMRTQQLSQEGALESLKLSCEFVRPNDGFLEQLKMFEEMGTLETNDVVSS
ncbi:dual specificity protein phosphatase 12-like [Hibiscus syriacus]|uniref:dual specificity protein phosphatase 12-like n=1 Tax=Hibiscus syriacus TaxID=106335 RepID=UPI00192247D8|nr:dual specificity protein phosphatase 12-like [Hibiscus syriacus]